MWSRFLFYSIENCCHIKLFSRHEQLQQKICYLNLTPSIHCHIVLAAFAQGKVDVLFYQVSQLDNIAQFFPGRQV